MSEKAHFLEQAVDFFNFRVPLSGVRLDDWYVERPDTPRPAMATYLRLKREPVKLIFVGSRGSGKSTELNKLTAGLAPRYYTFNLSIADLTGRLDVNYVDLMRAMLVQVTRAAIDDDLLERPVSQVFQTRLEGIYRWWRERVVGLGLPDQGPEASAKVKLSALLAEVEISAKQSGSTRETLNRELEMQMPQLIERLNWGLAEVKERSGRDPLLVVEQTDKVEESAARAIFRDRTPTIVAPQATTIFTLPSSLYYSDDFDSVRSRFDKTELFYNIAVRRQDGAPNPTGRRCLEQLVLKRLETQLIDPAALAHMIDMSGGHVQSLVFLVENAAIAALTRAQPPQRIIQADADYAVVQLRRLLVGPLSQQDYQTLQTCHADCPIVTNEAYLRRLLYNGALLEYAGDATTEGRSWCDAHPVLWTVLERGRHGSQQP